MRNIVVACALLVLGAVASAEAGGAPPAPSCCACLIEDHDTQIPALFCISANERELVLASQRCEETPDAALLCLARSSESEAVSPDCVEELLSNDILCPGVNSVPVIGVVGLVVVAGVLSLLGVMTLRRRSGVGPS